MNPANACTKVPGYQRKDETLVPVHYRCKRGDLPKQPSLSTAPLSGGPFNARGHLRKDGTLGQPSMRSRRRGM